MTNNSNHGTLGYISENSSVDSLSSKDQRISYHDQSIVSYDKTTNSSNQSTVYSNQMTIPSNQANSIDTLSLNNRREDYSITDLTIIRDPDFYELPVSYS